MNNEVFEEVQGAEGGAKAKLEKQARQLAYDTKYKVKQALAAKSGGKADPATVSKMYMAQLSKSPAPPAVKALAKKKLLGEEYVDVREFAVESVTSALLKVFVEKKEEVTEEVIEEEEKKTKSGEQKFHIKVTDKKTGNSYHRYATRAKIAELRANPNIATVEMSHQGEAATKKASKDYDGDGKVESSSKEHAGAVHNAIQRKKGGVPDGKDTRKEEVEIQEVTKMGVHSPHEVPSKDLKKLVKKAVKRIDADNDGDVDTDDPKETEMGEFVPSPDGKKRIKPIVQKEDFLSDWRDELFEGKKKDDGGEETIDVMKGKNKITVSPSISEKMNLAKADMGDVVKDFYKSDAPQFKGKSKRKRQQMAIAAKLTAERGGKKLGEAIEEKENEEKKGLSPEEQKQLQVKKQVLNRKRMMQMQTMQLQKQGKIPLNYSEECGVCDKCGKSPCECDKGGEDPRGMKTKADLVRNKLRAMGLKMSYEPEGEVVDEAQAMGSVRSGDQNPKGAAVRVSSGRGMTMTPARGLGASKPAGDDAKRAARQAAQAKADRIAAAKDRAKSGEDRLGRLIRSVQKSHYEPEGEMTEARNPEVEAQGKKVAGYEKEGKYQGITSKFRKENPGSRQKPKARGSKPTEGELTQARIQKHNQRVAKHGFTSKEKKESEARERYDSPRD